MDARNHITTAVAAERLTTTRDHIVDLINKGILPAVNISTGRKPRWRIPQADFDAFLAARTHRAPPTPARTRRRKPAKPPVDYFA